MTTMEEGWRWCQNCSCLWLSGRGNSGVCAASPKGHEQTGSEAYLMQCKKMYNGYDTRWRRCFLCSQAVRLFDKIEGGGRVVNSTKDYCPSGKHEHNTGDSKCYNLFTGSGLADADDCWRECIRCRSLWRHGHGGNVCSKGGGHSSGTAYSIQIKVKPRPKTAEELAEEKKQREQEREEEERRKREAEEMERQKLKQDLETWEKMTPDQKKAAMEEQEKMMGEFNKMVSGRAASAGHHFGMGAAGMGMPSGGMRDPFGGMGMPSGGMMQDPFGGMPHGMGMPSGGIGGMASGTRMPSAASMFGQGMDPTMLGRGTEDPFANMQGVPGGNRRPGAGQGGMPDMFRQF